MLAVKLVNNRFQKTYVHFSTGRYIHVEYTSIAVITEEITHVIVMLDGVENTAKQTSMNVIIRRAKMDPLATIKRVHMSACALSAGKINIAIKT
ncbi:hypothetical protein DPMN_098485 [Dreissena polymorpha]|uniref:Uncharacterized protein n=1 Tax=Dreissena polymorpha TaxID=45954 RepID=A0A9D4LD42_DREPO|nr:hypothetical protein DPMN_098485 [Dreissena polymorpha]